MSPKYSLGRAGQRSAVQLGARRALACCLPAACLPEPFSLKFVASTVGCFDAFARLRCMLHAYAQLHGHRWMGTATSCTQRMAPAYRYLQSRVPQVVVSGTADQRRLALRQLPCHSSCTPALAQSRQAAGGGGQLPAEADELPLPHRDLQGRLLQLPRLPPALGRAGHRVPLRALWHPAGALPRARLHPGEPERFLQCYAMTSAQRSARLLPPAICAKAVTLHRYEGPGTPYGLRRVRGCTQVCLLTYDASPSWLACLPACLLSACLFTCLRSVTATGRHAALQASDCAAPSGCSFLQ